MPKEDQGRPPSERTSESQTSETLVRSWFEKNGWTVTDPKPSAESTPDFVASRKGKFYLVEVKSASEVRKDRLLPLLSQAILVAKSYVREGDEIPVAVVVTNQIAEATVNEVRSFRQRYASDVALGLVDRNGFRWFEGGGLESLSSGVPQEKDQSFLRIPATAVFSDLHQWLLKVLLAPEITPQLLNAPRDRYGSATQLAEAAQVSVMTVTRFLKQFSQEGFLEGFQVVRRQQLFDRWRAAYANPPAELVAHWMLPGQNRIRFAKALRVALDTSKRRTRPAPEFCLGLFSAADELDVGFVHGAPSHLLMDHIEPKFLRDIGISILPDRPEHQIQLRVPSAPQSVFRGAVSREGILVSDILQTWLDVSSHPARGKEQADAIRHKFLGGLV